MLKFYVLQPTTTNLLDLWCHYYITLLHIIFGNKCFISFYFFAFSLAFGQCSWGNDHTADTALTVGKSPVSKMISALTELPD